MRLCCIVQYLTLLRAMASSLELESITGMRAMTHMPPDERAHLIKEREQAVELLCNRCALHYSAYCFPIT